MRFTLLLKVRAAVLLLLVTLTANLYAREVPFRFSVLQERPLVEALEELSEKYQVFFSYETELLNQIEVDFSFQKEENLEEAINRLLGATDLRYKYLGGKYYVIYRNYGKGLKTLKKLERKINQLIDLEKKGEFSLHPTMKDPSKRLQLIRHSASTMLVEKTISGKVSDENGAGLPGVNILVKNTNIGSITDVDGNYRLSAPDNASALVFSYVGYLTQEVTIGDQNTINVTLGPDIASLSEVVVVGYGTQQKKEITSAISTVSSEEFNKGNVNNPQQLLQGKVAGLTVTRAGGDPNQDFTVRMRGLTTLGANSEPLVVIDGVIGGSLNLIDPNDIETIDVLKDASAAAIYGTRGSSGVIIITTKSGRTGGKASFEYNGYLSAEEIGNVIDIASPERFVQLGGNDLGYKTDWLDEVSQTALSQVHNIAFSNSTENLSYRASINYRDIEGVLAGSGFNQLNGRLNISQKLLNNRLTLTSTVAVTQRDADVGYSQALRYALNFNPTAPVFVDNDPALGYYETKVQDVFNPVALNALNTRLVRRKSFLGNFQAQYEIIDGLKLSGNYSFQTISDLEGEYANSQAWFGGQRNNGSASRRTKDDLNELFELTGTYVGSTDAFNYTLLGGYSYQKLGFDEFSITNTDFISDEVTFYDLESGLGISDPAGIKSVASQREESKLISFFGRVNLNFSDAYYLSASYRREGSSKFGANNRWGNFWAASGGVNITQLVTIPVLDNLKVRAGYGVTGNPPVQNYAFLETLGAGPLGYSNGEYIPSIGPQSNPNPDLKWEEKGEFNAGIDFALLNFRLSGAVDYYIRNTTDLLNSVSVPSPPNQFGSSLVNIGELETKGFEVQLDYLVIDKPDFDWNIGANYSTFNTKLIRFNELANTNLLIANIGAPGLNNTYIVRLAEGEEIGQIMASPFVRYDEGGVAVMRDKEGNETTNRNSDDFIVAGHGLPDFNLGINNSFKYKQFDLNFFFRGSFGHSLANIQRAYFEHSSNVGKGNIVVTKHFTEADKGSDAWHDGYVEKASFMKLDNASLGYTFLFPEGSAFRNLRLYVTGQNIFTITGYSGSDPEVRYYDPGPTTEGNRQNQYGGNILAPGIDRRVTYLPTRTYTFGVNLGF